MKKAFTLIELLAVVAIVGLLVAFLLPVFGRAREEGRRAQCTNNLRQHGIAWYLYLDDHDYFFPLYGGAGMGNEGTFGGKRGKIRPPFTVYGAEDRILNRYLEIDSDTSPGIEVFHCPSDMKPAPPQDPYTSFDAYGTTYFASSRILAYDPGGGSDWRPRPFSTISRPHDRIWLEMCDVNALPGHSGRGRCDPRSPTIILFLDGHVAGMFYYDQDFERSGGSRVLEDANGTPAMYD